MPDEFKMGIEQFGYPAEEAPKDLQEVIAKAAREDIGLGLIEARAKYESDSTVSIPVNDLSPATMARVVSGLRELYLGSGVLHPIPSPWVEQDFRHPFGLGLAGPNVNWQLGSDVPKSAEKALRGMATAAKDELYQAYLLGYLNDHPNEAAVYDAKSGGMKNRGQVEASLRAIAERSYMRLVLMARGEEMPKEESGEQPFVRGGMPMMAPEVIDTHIAQVPADVEAQYRKSQAMKYAGFAGVLTLGALISACGETNPATLAPVVLPTTEASPTAVVPTVAPTEVPPTATTAPTEVPPTKTPEPTATEVSADSVATQNQDKMGGYYREDMTYSYTEENGVKYMADEYGNKMLKYENGAWVETSKEEKWGHMLWSEKDTNYQVEMKTGSNNIKQFTVNAAVWTGYYYRESIPFEEGGVDVDSTVIVLVTRDVNGKIVEILDVNPDYLPPTGRLQPADGSTVYSGASHNLQDLLDIFAKYNITLAGRPVNMTIFDTMVGSSGRSVGLKFYPTCSVSDTSWNGRLACSVHLGLEMGKAGKISFQDLFDTLNGSGAGEDSFTVYEVDAHINIMGEVGADQKAALQKDLDDLNAKFK